MRRTVPETAEVVSKPVPGDAGNAASRIDTAARAPNIDATRINIEATRINIAATRINIDATGRNSGANGVKIVSTRIGRARIRTDPGSTRCHSGSESPKTGATRTDPALARSVRPCARIEVGSACSDRCPTRFDFDPCGAVSVVALLAKALRQRAYVALAPGRDAVASVRRNGPQSSPPLPSLSRGEGGREGRGRVVRPSGVTGEYRLHTKV
jgi:hypothetical protein